MPKIKMKGKEVTIPKDGNSSSKFEELGIALSCCGGICGTCKIKVLKGMENINPKTEEEMEFQLEKNERLACQCHKIKGDIEIDYEEW